MKRGKMQRKERKVQGGSCGQASSLCVARAAKTKKSDRKAISSSSSCSARTLLARFYKILFGECYLYL